MRHGTRLHPHPHLKTGWLPFRPAPGMRQVLRNFPALRRNSGCPIFPNLLKLFFQRNLSPEGRKRIQEAMQRRWADRRKGSSKEAPVS